jgi:hypothetical protein
MKQWNLETLTNPPENELHWRKKIIKESGSIETTIIGDSPIRFDFGFSASIELKKIEDQEKLSYWVKCITSINLLLSKNIGGLIEASEKLTEIYDFHIETNQDRKKELPTYKRIITSKVVSKNTRPPISIDFD